ncbi:MAG: hypothetical protein NT070_18595 [Cyanobacteria bacterium]|nr:hypothetical protein [Cyanobacteriota bacterium]
MNKRFAFLPVAVLAMISLASSAQAAPFKDAAGVVHFQDAGQTVGQKLNLELTGTPLTRSVVTNQCGLVTIPVPSATVPIPTNVQLGTTNIDTTYLPVSATPKCALNTTTGTYSLLTPVTGNFKTISGQVVVVNQTPSLAQLVQYTGVGKSKVLTVGKCGEAKLGSASAPAPITFKFSGTDYTTASLPMAVPARCIGGIKYIVAP